MSAAISKVFAYSGLELCLTLIYRFLLFFCDTLHQCPSFHLLFVFIQNQGYDSFTSLPCWFL